MERVRYDLLFVINTMTFAVACNSAVWAVLLCVSVHQHRIPFLGIRPSNVPSSGSLEHIAPIFWSRGVCSVECSARILTRGFLECAQGFEVVVSVVEIELA